MGWYHLPFFRSSTVKSPSKSPDLNPIEMIWSELKTYVRKRNIKTIEEAVESIRSFQKNLTPEHCVKYINNLKKTIKIVIEIMIILKKIVSSFLICNDSTYLLSFKEKMQMILIELVNLCVESTNRGID
ncbi:Transposable element Tcb1 transposase [Brachionus plicatilis]|uniref:Transposable element Tcb1 transposase n=1 Tax=Brachionus plicatilis TaxID=10195 RepID=A0A3M7SZP7_BRAPC|nr:Transposable element Tcb1 transposase [Brachionus plicatilis]